MKPYHRRVAPTWWLSQRTYFFFILRELTSVFIAAYLMLFLLLLHNLSLGREAYEAYLRFLAMPGMLAGHVLALAAALFHMVTWFNLLPNIMVVRYGENRVPAIIVAGVNYVAWIAVSIFIAWIVLSR
jgi:fumarate reductase subunit C